MTETELKRFTISLNKVYFTNAEFEYQNAKRKVEINEYMIAFKE